MKIIPSIKRGIILGLTLGSITLCALVVDTALYVRHLKSHIPVLTGKGAY